LHPEIQFQKNGNINGKTPTEVEATLNTIRIYPKNAADFPSKPVSAIITGLRFGFIPLNHYKHLTNQIDSPNCLCGESETVHHYLLQCPNYEEEREGFRTELYFATGSLNLDLDT
jgi:hypothetical protein